MSPLAWVLTGAALYLSLLGAMTIGIFVLPFALVALLALLRWGNRNDSALLLSGAGFPLFYVAYLNRNGPGTVCRAIGGGGQECMEELNPWPFLLIGASLLAAGLVRFYWMRRRISA